MTAACALTVDVEDYYHVEAFSSLVRREDWPKYESRVERNTYRVLDLFGEYQAKGTFFVLGWVAERYPGLVKEIRRRGHEIACHSYWHRLVYKLSPREFRDDTIRAKNILESTTGAPVLGYRAPSFSIVRQSLWALEILAEQDFRYDSSIYPIYRRLYGIRDWYRSPQWWDTNAGPILTIPASTIRLFGVNVPCGGGGYLRFFPLAFNRRALQRKTAKDGFGLIYIHPWELDPDQPHLPGSLASRFRHYTGLGSTEGRLRILLKELRVGPIAEVMHAELDYQMAGEEQGVAFGDPVGIR